MRPVRVLLFMHKTDPDGCTWYRVEQFSRYANRNNLADCKYIDLSLSEDVLKSVLEASDVFFARLSPLLPDVLEYLEELNIRKPLVLDIDDIIHDIDPLSQHYRTLGLKEVKLTDGSWLWKDGVGGFSIEENKERVASYERCIKLADVLITTTFKLREWLQTLTDKPIAVIPNAIDFELFPQVRDLNKKDEEIRIVWSGGSSHFSDLYEVAPYLGKVVNSFNNVFYYSVGMHFGAVAKNIPADRYVHKRWVQAEAHGFRLACLSPDISICPLVENTFNTYKSSVKFYEMSALKVPTLAKNMLPYKDDIRDGENGLLYNDYKEFEEKLTALINDKSLREKLGNASYEYVREFRSIEKIGREWVEIISSLRG